MAPKPSISVSRRATSFFSPQLPASSLCSLTPRATYRIYQACAFANLMQLTHNMAVDVYLENTVSAARLVIVRLFRWGRLLVIWSGAAGRPCAEKDIHLAIVPGDDQPDPELMMYCTLAPEACHRLWQYCAHGGPDAENLLNYAASLLDRDTSWKEPIPLVAQAIIGRTDRCPRDKTSWTSGKKIAQLQQSYFTGRCCKVAIYGRWMP